MKFSIITPLYNQKEYFSYCCHSIAIQTYKDFEHVIIDNESNDGSLTVLRDLGEYNCVVVSEADSGQAEAVNKGISLSSGDFVIWLNADDMLADEFVLERLSVILESDSSSDVLYGGVRFVDVNGGLVRKVKSLWPWFEMLKHVAYIGNSNLCVRRTVALEFPINEDLHFILDHEWCLRILGSGKWKWSRVPFILVDFRLHSESKTSTYSEDRKNVERLIRSESFQFGSGLIWQVKGFAFRFLFFVMTFSGRRVFRFLDG